MINITFPDGNQREYEKGSSAMDIAKSISHGLAKKVLAAEVNGEVWDLTRPIQDDSSLKLLTWEDNEGKSTFWHSTAHLMAEALEVEFPGVKFGIGPAIDRGFYYDIDLGDRTLSDRDLEKLEKRMKKLVSHNSTYEREDVSKADAIKYFTEKDDEYKLELLQDLEDGSITFYKQGSFVDLCRGPHLPSTKYIKAIKLLSVAGAYWRGDENNKQLTRIYGVSFPKQEQLDEHLEMLEKARERDHRKLGQELDIFTFHDMVGPGLPLWLPNGAFLIDQLEDLAKRTETRAGYKRVRTPHIAKESMYLTSGHLPYYKDGMFPPMEMDGTTYYLKAMNCPHHHMIYDARPRSYRDLPLRYTEYGTCYRYEKSGELFGLMRVRSLQMNDAHIYCTEDQFEEEFKAVNRLYTYYFKILGIEKYQMRFSTHEPSKLGKKYMDKPELWKKTEDMVRRVLIDSELPYVEVPDEAAFYGPKIDIQIWSAIGREFTLATNQVDFAQPLSFDLTYTTPDNEKARPIIIHRAPLSTHERMIGFLLEHYAGNFPLWLAPEQVAILPISDKFLDYAKEVEQQLLNKEFRPKLDSRTEKIGRKIRDAEVQKIPYMLVIGEREVANGEVAIRRKGEGNIGTMKVPEFLQMLEERLKAETDYEF
ncbi:MAG: threonine--tRNA ligase [Bacteroidota bacterium]